MKRIVSCILCLVVLISILSGNALAINGSAPSLQSTDYTTSDLVQLMKFIVGAESSFDASTADINGDGETDILDVIHLLLMLQDKQKPDDTVPDSDILVMATDAEFPPYAYYENNKIVGIDVEIGAAIAEELGMELVVESMPYSSIVPAVASGKVDMALAGLVATEERLKSVCFSTTYATNIQVLLVTEGSEITMDGLFHIGGYTIGVKRNTTADLYCTWDLEDSCLATIERYDKGSDAVAALLNGEVDCVVIDNQLAEAFLETDNSLRILETAYAVEDYAIALAKGSDLAEIVDGTLRELIADGTVQAILDKYISE